MWTRFRLVLLLLIIFGCGQPNDVFAQDTGDTLGINDPELQALMNDPIFGFDDPEVQAAIEKRNAKRKAIESIDDEMQRYLLSDQADRDYAALVQRIESGKATDEDFLAFLQLTIKFDALEAKYDPENNVGSSGDEISGGVKKVFLYILMRARKVWGDGEGARRIEKRLQFADLETESVSPIVLGIVLAVVPFVILCFLLGILVTSSVKRILGSRRERTIPQPPQPHRQQGPIDSHSQSNSFFNKLKDIIAHLNSRQKTVFRIGLFLIFLLVIFPPWLENKPISDSRRYVASGEHQFILSPSYVARGLDLSRYFGEGMLIVIMTSGLIYIFRDRQ